MSELFSVPDTGLNFSHVMLRADKQVLSRYIADGANGTELHLDKLVDFGLTLPRVGKDSAESIRKDHWLAKPLRIAGQREIDDDDGHIHGHRLEVEFYITNIKEMVNLRAVARVLSIVSGGLVEVTNERRADGRLHWIGGFTMYQGECLESQAHNLGELVEVLDEFQSVYPLSAEQLDEFMEDVYCHELGKENFIIDTILMDNGMDVVVDLLALMAKKAKPFKVVVPFSRDVEIKPRMLRQLLACIMSGEINEGQLETFGLNVSKFWFLNRTIDPKVELTAPGVLTISGKATHPKSIINAVNEGKINGARS